ncbi:U11/U12 small nuclear ribonucleoprotein 48 kDa protein [Rhinophrynus dorsalis]
MECPVPESPQYLLRELQDFTERCRSRLNEILEQLGWDHEVFSGEQETAICPYDDGHRMPKSSLEKHVAMCRLRKLGYSKEEAEEYDTRFYYQKTKIPSVVIEREQQFHIIKEARNSAPSGRDDLSYDKSAYSTSPVEVPHNHKRAICDLGPADRLAIYNYVLDETKKQRSAAQTEQNESDLFEDLAAKINQDDKEKEPKSHLEIIAEMRDYKRRRQSYRAKNVHITKKSYTEIIRDVISVHMEELSSHWQGEMHDEASSSISSSSARRRALQRSPSADSRHSGGSHRERQRSGRRREHSRSPRRHHNRDREKDSKRKKERQDYVPHMFI